ncbi:hypothetical protein MGALLINA_06240 [Mycoplasmopsis gallinarum]|uniref:Uncharacterized protein n=1 Tax=Mycoplasmopsis gallinarum TaxID=29557 RepID=A0A168R6A0_9BACT|nr:hypothetical protein MGALLINA_06240 [Mycoplasmopsis gallinarum]
MIISIVFIISQLLIKCKIKQKPINLIHFIERIKNLTTIFIGTSLVPFFSFSKPVDFTGFFLLIYLGVLFFYYVIHFDKIADRSRQINSKREIILIFTHYIIFVALSWNNMSLELLSSGKISYFSNWIFQHLSLITIVLMLFVNVFIIGKSEFKYGFYLLISEVIVILFGFGLGFINIENFNWGIINEAIQMIILWLLIFFSPKINKKNCFFTKHN